MPVADRTMPVTGGEHGMNAEAIRMPFEYHLANLMVRLRDRR